MAKAIPARAKETKLRIRTGRKASWLTRERRARVSTPAAWNSRRSSQGCLHSSAAAAGSSCVLSNRPCSSPAD